jgi:hypothetical protein
LRQNTLENNSNVLYTLDVPSANFDEIMLTEIYQGNPSFNFVNDSLGFLQSVKKDSISNQDK